MCIASQNSRGEERWGCFPVGDIENKVFGNSSTSFQSQPPATPINEKVKENFKKVYNS